MVGIDKLKLIFSVLDGGEQVKIGCKFLISYSEKKLNLNLKLIVYFPDYNRDMEDISSSDWKASREIYEKEDRYRRWRRAAELDQVMTRQEKASMGWEDRADKRRQKRSRRKEKLEKSRPERSSSSRERRKEKLRKTKNRKGMKLVLVVRVGDKNM